jgi:hypothetical protein
MKKIVLVLAVLIMAAPLFAAGIKFTATPAEGSCTISYEVVYGTSTPVAMALNVDVTSGASIASIDGIDSFFDVFIDLAYDMEQASQGSYTYVPNNPSGSPAAKQDQAGEQALPSSNFCISMGGLGGMDGNNLVPAGPSGTVAVLHADAASAGLITVNSLRGGIVDSDGEYMEPNGLPLAFEILEGAVCCPGDIANALQQPPGDNVDVHLGDINHLVARLAANGFAPFTVSTLPPEDAYLACADVADSLQNWDPDGDDTVHISDLNYIIGEVAANGFAPLPCPQGVAPPG